VSEARQGILRTTALIALLIGAAGSFALMLYAGRNAPRFLVVLFTIWDLSPFVALALADVLSRRWTRLAGVTLYAGCWRLQWEP
jgi:uncharacterized membrane protein YgdD (TMEM256/DUF423 family)